MNAGRGPNPDIIRILRQLFNVAASSRSGGGSGGSSSSGGGGGNQFKALFGGSGALLGLAGLAYGINGSIYNGI